ncbi:Mitochondrial inner membrane protein oxa1 [Lunasporangiospora selenospora]|uniref:Mitochondrial inner membrane protein oxa1 n=1 Tax=Lunasporangiospora selenospora TaxID=979761 RepID=A0A9P6FZ96_9FUNG|nr:Mitochondrial inner membrane protein oxa1 [Lunasporangiospora selenospora]
MSNHPQESRDPPTAAHLGDAPEEDNAAGSTILLQRNDYESSPGPSSPEVTSLHSSAIFDHPSDEGECEKSLPLVPATLEATPGAFPGSKAAPTKKPVSALTTTAPISTSTALIPAQDLNQTMPWKLFYPIASRETILWFAKATAINFVLPFINGVFLGFGEICAHELTFRWGWTNSAHVVTVPGRKPGQSANAGGVGLSAAGSNVSSTPSPAGYAGSRSGIGGLGAYENDSE